MKWMDWSWQLMGCSSLFGLPPTNSNPLHCLLQCNLHYNIRLLHCVHPTYTNPLCWFLWCSLHCNILLLHCVYPSAPIHLTSCCNVVCTIIQGFCTVLIPHQPISLLALVHFALLYIAFALCTSHHSNALHWLLHCCLHCYSVMCLLPLQPTSLHI